MFKDDILKDRGFENWLEAFTYLKKHKKGKFILAVDEYPYLVETDKSISSIFQKGWDQTLKNSGIFMVLSGSSIGMMESEVLAYKAPLYGRRTGQILIKPLPFNEMRGFFSFPGKKPLLSFKRSGFIRVWSVFFPFTGAL